MKIRRGCITSFRTANIAMDIVDASMAARALCTIYARLNI